MGRAALDGDFGVFQAGILSLEVSFGDLAVRCNTLRGETLAFGWEGPLLRDGQVQPLSTDKHYENAYCVAELPAERMDIRHGDLVMRLELGER